MALIIIVVGVIDGLSCCDFILVVVVCSAHNTKHKWGRKEKKRKPACLQYPIIRG
jgi:hypothetical protein